MSPGDTSIPDTSGSIIGHADYGNCSGSLIEQLTSSTDTKLVFSQTLTNNSGGTCPTASYVTLTSVGSSMSWAMSSSSYSASYANGTLAKQ